jgi:hypothetical protein
VSKSSPATLVRSPNGTARSKFRWDADPPESRPPLVFADGAIVYGVTSSNQVFVDDRHVIRPNHSVDQQEIPGLIYPIVPGRFASDPDTVNTYED